MSIEEHGRVECMVVLCCCFFVNVKCDPRVLTMRHGFFVVFWSGGCCAIQMAVVVLPRINPTSHEQRMMLVAPFPRSIVLAMIVVLKCSERHLHHKKKEEKEEEKTKTQTQAQTQTRNTAKEQRRQRRQRRHHQRTTISK